MANTEKLRLEQRQRQVIQVAPPLGIGFFLYGLVPLIWFSEINTELEFRTHMLETGLCDETG